MAELVTDYLEGNLAWHRRLSARWHLLLCTACTRYFDQMRRTVGLLRDGPAPVLPSDQENQLIQAITPEPPAV